MKFTDWWNGLSGFSDFTRKELSASTGIPKRFKYYEAALERAFYAGKPKPSTDFTIPKSNPYKEFLLYEDGIGWYIGYYDDRWITFIRPDPTEGGEIFCHPSYWLLMPDAPEEE